MSNWGEKTSQHRDERGKVRRCLEGRCQGHHGAIELGLENQRSGRKVFENTFFFLGTENIAANSQG